MSQDKPDRNDQDLGVLREMVEAVKADAPETDDYAFARRRLLRKLRGEKQENPIMNMIRTTTRSKLRWVTVTGALALAIAVFVVMNPSGVGPGQVYAEVVEQLRNALTVSFNAAWYFDENEEPSILEMTFREPGIKRIGMTHEGTQVVQVVDTNRNQAIVLMPETKTYVQMNLENMPSVERERIQLIQLISEEIKSLPSKAEEDLGEIEFEGRTVRGFRAGHKKIWIDVKTQQLAYIDQPLGGTRLVMTDFRIDPNDLDDSAFSIAPPEGYTSISKGPLAYQNSEPDEEDLVEYLRMVATWTKGQTFPATLNPLEVLTLQKEGKLDESREVSPEEEQREIKTFTRVSQNTVIFVTKMRPVNDWQYRGKGVTYGDSGTPIAWWKPSGTNTYRVVWGDLSTTSVPPGDIARVTNR